MKVITYLGFTVLSIFIQFCVMDFIQEKINEKPADMNITYQKKAVDDLLKNISSKPHALYYRTQITKTSKRSLATISFPEKIFNNSSAAVDNLGTTDISTTIFDIFYDDNTSSTESTTETFFTTTEFANVTEITFYETKNNSDIPNNVPKITYSKHCVCNLLYRVCDINCCCDEDCNYDEQKYFQCEKTSNDRLYNDRCKSHLLESNFNYGSSMMDNLFCIAKTNLPDKRNIQKPNLEKIIQYHKWRKVQQKQTLLEFRKNLYNQSDPIWILKNGTIYHLDFPIPSINNYCTDRAPVEFLKDEKVQCIVKFNELEMFHVSRASEESMVISATEKTFNSSTMNCSNLHCINWTILACKNDICHNYNKSSNEASCTDNTCTNVALKTDYLFNYIDQKIINATIKLHIQNISHLLPYLSQEISVKFIMSNRSIDNIIQFSGNPGYIHNLPIIISDAKSNYTENFFTNTVEKNLMVFPENHNGICVLVNSSRNIVRFGVNKRTKCRYIHKHHTKNNIDVCKSIQDNIDSLLKINKLYISPYGNPFGISDDDWVVLPEITNREPVYGTYSENVSKLHCYNIINSVSVIFIYASVDENKFNNQNKILLAKYETAVSNISFNIEEVSTVITININFVDATKPNLYVYAGSPHVNIYLPKDFFFPFPHNDCLSLFNSRTVTLICYVITFFF